MKWTETLIIAVLAAVLPFIAGLLKEVLSVFHLRATRQKESVAVELERNKQVDQSMLEVMRFLEDRNELLSNSLDKSHERYELLLRELHAAREVNIRLECRLEYGKSLEDGGMSRAHAIARVDQIEAFSTDERDAIIITDPEYHIISATPKALLLFGYTSLEEFKQNQINHYIPELHSTAFSAGVKGIAEIFQGHKNTVGIVGNPLKLAAVHKNGNKMQLTAILKTWNDAEKILFATVIVPDSESLKLPA